MKSPIFVAAGLVCVLGASNNAAHAVVLEQKWQTGKILTYDTNLSGSVNVKIPASIPSPIAGIPLDVDIDGQGKMQLETLRVDEAGTGTVAFKFPDFTLDAKDQTFGIPAKFTLSGGKTNVTIAGKPQEWGKGWGANAVPTSAVKIGKNGHIKGFEPIQANAPAANGATPQAPNAIGAATIQPSMMAALISQALPALLPDKEVQKGDQWKSDVKFAAVARTNEQTGEVLPLGSFDMILKGEENVAGKSLWRIGVKGKVDVDGEKVNALSKQAPQTRGNAAVPQLESATQTVEGDIWFDAQAGQIYNAELILGSNTSTFLPAKPGKKSEPSWLDFTGTLTMKLAEKA